MMQKILEMENEQRQQKTQKNGQVNITRKEEIKEFQNNQMDDVNRKKILPVPPPPPPTPATKLTQPKLCCQPKLEATRLHSGYSLQPGIGQEQNKMPAKEGGKSGGRTK